MRWIRVFLSAAVLGLSGACALGPTGALMRWRTDFESAERAARGTDTPLFIYYDNTRPGVHDDLRDLLRDEGLREALKPYTCCKLFRSSEPDRRYVAQFGVERAPAVIIVHRDGTYHAVSGIQTTGEVLNFLERANPPGATPVRDDLLPRERSLAWERAADVSLERLTSSSSPTLVVYARRMTGDWGQVRSLLERLEIRRRLAGWRIRRVTVGWPWSQRTETAFGQLALPAVVAVAPHGGYYTAERPQTLTDIGTILLAASEPSAQVDDLAVSRRTE
ncbi:MAG: hypothetical protein J5J06_08370 [Phycisphaerae bacterium]|nr:hypothetical protein [Phycisphaerae bacterium]